MLKNLRTPIMTLLALAVTFSSTSLTAATKDAQGANIPWVASAWNGTTEFGLRFFGSIREGFVNVFSSIDKGIDKAIGTSPSKISRATWKFLLKIPGAIADFGKKLWSLLLFSKLKL